MKCLICQGENIETIETKMSDFLVARIFGDDAVSKGLNVNLCHCNVCSFSFYDRRLSDEEEIKLYKNYREKDYQKAREKYDCWYTEKVNNAMNCDEQALKEQQRIIAKIIKENIKKPLNRGLDYGGNEEKTYCDEFGIKEKYCYDISNVDTVTGVKKISCAEELKNYSFDFIMCNMTLEHISNPISFTKTLYNIGDKGTYYYFEVPSENPFSNNKFSVLKNISLLTNKYYSNIKLAKHYFNLRQQPYMPMTEHVNFYTPKSIKILMQNVGFNVITVEENFKKSVLGGGLVLSVLCQK